MKSLLTIALIPTEKSKEEALFKAVLLQAIEDANYEGIINPELNYKLEAIEWLTDYETFWNNNFASLARHFDKKKKDIVSRLRIARV